MAFPVPEFPAMISPACVKQSRAWQSQHLVLSTPVWKPKSKSREAFAQEGGLFDSSLNPSFNPAADSIERSRSTSSVRRPPERTASSWSRTFCIPEASGSDAV